MKLDNVGDECTINSFGIGQEEKEWHQEKNKEEHRIEFKMSEIKVDKQENEDNVKKA